MHKSYMQVKRYYTYIYNYIAQLLWNSLPPDTHKSSLYQYSVSNWPLISNDRTTQSANNIIIDDCDFILK